MPKPTPHFTCYEDLPPPSPEEQDRFYERLEKTIGDIERQALRKKRDWYLQFTDDWP